MSRLFNNDIIFENYFLWVSTWYSDSTLSIDTILSPFSIYLFSIFKIDQLSWPMFQITLPLSCVDLPLRFELSISMSQTVGPIAVVGGAITPFAFTRSCPLPVLVHRSVEFARIKHCESLGGDVLLPICNYHGLNHCSFDLLNTDSSIRVHDLLLHCSCSNLHILHLLYWNLIHHLLLVLLLHLCISLGNCRSVLNSVVCHTVIRMSRFIIK